MNGQDLSTGLFLRPQFKPTGLTLTGATYAINGRPTLFISPSPGAVLVMWPLGYSNWGLQSMTNLTAPAWTPLPAGPCGNQAALPVTGPQRYFRLIP